MEKVLETERLYLRELTLNDCDDLMRVLSDPESMEHYPKPYDREGVEKWIRWSIDNYSKYGHGLWAVILKEDDSFIGDCGVTMQNIDGEILPEVGFHIIKDYWKCGYATEAATACRDYVFEKFNYDKLFSYCLKSNSSSQRVAEKIGMKLYKEYKRDEDKIIAQFIAKS